MATNPSVIDLSTLDGTSGFRLDGFDERGRSGRSVASAGDVNGDGFGDIIVGAYNADPGGDGYAGQSYVVFGKADVFAASIDLSTLDGTNGFRINGIDASDRSGCSVASAGDVNGDGFGDIIIGAFGGDPGGDTYGGESYVVFGKAAGFTADLDLSTLDGANGFRLDGIDIRDYNGWSVASAGDVNGDGFDDIIIGAKEADPGAKSSAGESYVVFGAADGFAASIDLATLDGTDGFRLDGVDGGDLIGWSVASAGDVNGDGFDDIIIGAISGDPGGDSGAGESYVVFGKANGFAASLDLSTLDGSNGFRLDGIVASDTSGWSVATAGDVNGDGFDDIIIGAPAANPGGDMDAGENYVVFGKADGFAASLDLSTLDGSNGFRLVGIDAYDRSGTSVASAGDVNGDGFDDIIIGADRGDPGGDSSAGESYVVFGMANGFAASIDLSTLDGSNGFRLDGIDVDDSSGRSVASAGDVNGDGFDDIIIGASGGDPGGVSNAGESYVVFGRATDDIDRTGTTGTDRLFSGDFNDKLRGLAGKDTLTAGEGNDILNGGAGNDTLLAGSGLDFLRGGSGADTMTGGTGSDWFKFDLGDSGQIAKTMDTITDFETGVVGTGDRIDFTALLSIGGTSAATTANQASIDADTGIASFHGNSGTGLADALSDIATSFTTAGDAAGDFALFQLGGTGAFHLFISDGVAGVGSNDVLVQLTNITSVNTIDLTSGDLTILN